MATYFYNYGNLSNRLIKINVRHFDFDFFFLVRTNSRFFMSRKPLKLLWNVNKFVSLEVFSIKIKNLLAIVVKEFFKSVLFDFFFLMISSTHSEGKKQKYIEQKFKKQNIKIKWWRWCHWAPTLGLRKF